MKTVIMGVDAAMTEGTHGLPYQPSSQTDRSRAVIILERDGSLFYQEPDQHQDAGNNIHGAMPAGLVAVDEHNDLIERIFHFAVDALGLNRVELHVADTKTLCVER